MKLILILLSSLLVTVAFAQNTPKGPVTKNTNTHDITEDLRFGTGRTLSMLSGSTLNLTGASVVGAVLTAPNIGAATGTSVSLSSGVAVPLSISGGTTRGFLTNPHVIAELRNPTDNDTWMTFRAGATGERRMYLGFLDYLGEYKWLTGRNANNYWVLYDAAAGTHRLFAPSGGLTDIASAGTSQVRINSNPNSDASSGTGGLAVFSGGASPTVWHTLDGSGITSTVGTISAPTLTATDSAGTTTLAGSLAVDPTQPGLMYDFATKRVAIGTSSYTRRLNVSTPNGTAEAIRVTHAGVGSWDLGVTSGDAFAIWDQNIASPYFSIATGGAATFANNLTASGNLTVNGTGTHSIGGTGASLVIAGTSAIKGVRTAIASLDFPSVNAGAAADLPVNVPGATVGSIAHVNPADGPLITAGMILQSAVTAADTVTVRVWNATSGAVNLAPQNFRVVVIGF